VTHETSATGVSKATFFYTARLYSIERFVSFISRLFRV
jgi:hypothetical protein